MNIKAIELPKTKSAFGKRIFPILALLRFAKMFRFLPILGQFLLPLV